MLNANKQCLNCQKEVSISSTDLKTKSAHCNQKEFELLYAICPYCGKEIHIQLDDDWTKQILNDNKKMFVKLAKKRENHSTISPKDNERFQKKRKHLIKARKNLVNLLNNKECIDSDGNPFIVRITI